MPVHLGEEDDALDLGQDCGRWTEKGQRWGEEIARGGAGRLPGWDCREAAAEEQLSFLAASDGGEAGAELGPGSREGSSVWGQGLSATSPCRWQCPA